ncbi:biosynthetic-type acetolactate synthase large subunit [Gudongella sp. SC589]|uniref:biosynthetic-type acetolactate synthase large subunit n=1 Tax=Gudongella sp. SC589 TaxID=3385990 RepID=UPI003904677E
MKMLVADAIVECIKLESIDTVFGYPGGAVLPLYESLRKSSVKHVLVRQEQSAAHMASGYGRVNNTVGVCIATSGPGATNLITGLATAYMDSVPIVAITGQVNSKKIGTDMFQEADVVGSSEAFTKHNYLVKDGDDIPRIIKEAFHIANTGRKGPVLIDVPKDIQNQYIEFEYPDSVDIRGYKPTIEGHIKQISRIHERINQALKPIICVGGGISSSGCKDELIEFVSKTKIPVVCTLMGVDSFPNDNPYFAGLLGSHGYPFVNRAMNRADLIIVIGARFADRSTAVISDKIPNQHVIHIDIDPAEIGKNVKTHTPVVGDAGAILRQLNSYEYRNEISQWSDSIREERKRYMDENINRSFQEPGVNPCRFIRAISNKLGEKAVVTSDVGQNQIWTAHYLIAGNGRRYFTSGGLGTMGYSLPAAIGASFSVDEDESVTAIMGEGGFQMLMGELALIREHNLNIKVIIITNERLGMVRELQLTAYGDSSYHGVDIGFNPDFMKLAEAYGIKGYLVEEDSQIEDVLSGAYSSDEPCLIQCRVNPDFPTLAHWRWK